jgi:hypothetical protein
VLAGLPEGCIRKDCVALPQGIELVTGVPDVLRFTPIESGPLAVEIDPEWRAGTSAA